jgi:RimJ/RimL family protein N-acetyltransferase
MSRKEQASFTLSELQEGHRPALERLQSRSEVQARLGRILDVRRDVSSGVLALETDGDFAGIVGLVPSGALDGTEVELVCALLAEYEGRGLATVACRQILVAEARHTRRPRVLASIAPDNSAGRLLADRLGFKRIGARATSSDELWAVSLSDFVVAAV